MHFSSLILPTDPSGRGVQCVGPWLLIAGIVGSDPTDGMDVCIAESEREGTRAETRLGLSAKRTSPFKSAGGGTFSRLLAVEECGSAGKTTATDSIRIFPLHFPSRASPCAVSFRFSSTLVFLGVV
jgi:hypothetical protein